MRRLITFICAAAIVACLAAPPALAQSQVVSDCASNGQLTRTYSAAQLRAALASMPVTVKEYTSCSDIIQAALLKAIGQSGSGNGGNSGSGSGGSSFPTVLLVLLVLLALAGVTFGALAIRRRGGGGGGVGGASGASGAGQDP